MSDGPGIGAVIVCDDVRKEVTNKDILIGVYAGDIVVPAFPAVLTVAFWIELRRPVGHYDDEFRVTIGDKPVTRLGMALDITGPGAIGITIPPMLIKLDKEDEIGLEILEGDSWVEIKRKKVTAGDVARPSGVAPLGGRVPGNT